MLILSRKISESIVIDGRIKVTVIRLDGKVVKLGIEAPVEVAVHRQEVYDEIQLSNEQAVLHQTASLPKVVLAQPKNSPSTFKPWPGDGRSKSVRRHEGLEHPSSGPPCEGEESRVLPVA